jgi:hypothetical protein
MTRGGRRPKPIRFKAHSVPLVKPADGRKQRQAQVESGVSFFSQELNDFQTLQNAFQRLTSFSQLQSSESRLRNANLANPAFHNGGIAKISDLHDAEMSYMLPVFLISGLAQQTMYPIVQGSTGSPTSPVLSPALTY